jgi:hypothetical protein
MKFPQIRKPGTYKCREWRYELEVAGAGSKSERLHGTLYKDDRLLEGKPGDIAETPIGRFANFRRLPWSVGWLSVLSTGGSPVFAESGDLTPAAKWCVEQSSQDGG